jgi:beta-phosphoglucomutase
LCRDNRIRITEPQVVELIQRKRAYYQKFAPAAMRRDASDAIDWLKKNEYRIGLVSGSARQNIQAVIAAREMELFDITVCAEDYTLAKPDPEPYLIGVEKLGLKPSEVVVIENAPLGIQSARAAGVTVIGLMSTLPADELFEAHYLIKSLDTLQKLLPGVRQ